MASHQFCLFYRLVSTFHALLLSFILMLMLLCCRYILVRYIYNLTSSVYHTDWYILVRLWALSRFPVPKASNFRHRIVWSIDWSMVDWSAILWSSIVLLLIEDGEAFPRLAKCRSPFVELDCPHFNFAPFFFTEFGSGGSFWVYPCVEISVANTGSFVSFIHMRLAPSTKWSKKYCLYGCLNTFIR